MLLESFAGGVNSKTFIAVSHLQLVSEHSRWFLNTFLKRDLDADGL